MTTYVNDTAIIRETLSNSNAVPVGSTAVIRETLSNSNAVPVGSTAVIRETLLSVIPDHFDIILLQCNQIPDIDKDRDIYLRYSDTAGASWSNKIAQTSGLTGDYYTNIQYQRLGYGRNRVFEVSWSGDFKTALTGVFITVEKSTS
jgi:hypothetical protein